MSIIKMKDGKLIIRDVTLREFGQNVPTGYLHIFNPMVRVEIAKRLLQAGIKEIELFSCINPRIAPAMDEEELEKIVNLLGRVEDARIIVLVPNWRGYETFLRLELGPERYNYTLGLFFSAVEEHNRLNLGRSIEETVKEYQRIIKDACSKDISIFGYISAVFGYMGKAGLMEADPRVVNHYIDMLFDMGAEIVTISDLQGVADKIRTEKVIGEILKGRNEEEILRIAYHPHHISSSFAVEMSILAYRMGIRRFDASIGGTGGCITGAPGNQSTEDLIQGFISNNIYIDIDLKSILSLSHFVRSELYEKIPLAKSAPL